MYIRTTIVLVLLSLFRPQIYSQTVSRRGYKLVVSLQNAPFTSLALRDYRDMHNLIIKGRHISQFKWEFTIPDSIVDNSEFMEIIVPQKDSVENAFRQVRFIRKWNNKKNIIANIGVQGRTNFINAKYIGKEIFKGENIASFLGKIDSVQIGELVCDDFGLSLRNDSSDIEVRSLDPYFAWFDGGNSKMSYEQNLQSYIDLVKKYPDSRYLITYLSLNLNRFKSRADVKKIYDYFSEKTRELKWAGRIERFLSLDKFQNISLINLDTKNLEPLIKDKSKYNLIIFSASWCGPCIAEMPLLKDLYKNLKDRFGFTNISMDYQQKVKAFQDILLKNSIPWRTLYAYEDLDRITDMFSIKSIPLSLLVYPDGRVEALDVRDPANQKRLLSLP